MFCVFSFLSSLGNSFPVFSNPTQLLKVDALVPWFGNPQIFCNINKLLLIINLTSYVNKSVQYVYATPCMKIQHPQWCVSKANKQPFDTLEILHGKKRVTISVPIFFRSISECWVTFCCHVFYTCEEKQHKKWLHQHMERYLWSWRVLGWILITFL